MLKRFVRRWKMKLASRAAADFARFLVTEACNTVIDIASDLPEKKVEALSDDLMILVGKHHDTIDECISIAKDRFSLFGQKMDRMAGYSAFKFNWISQEFGSGKKTNPPMINPAPQIMTFEDKLEEAKEGFEYYRKQIENLEKQAPALRTTPDLAGIETEMRKVY